MVNMDTLGLAPTEVWASHSDKLLTGALYYIATQLNIRVSGVDVEQIGSTDSVQFAERKIPSITSLLDPGDLQRPHPPLLQRQALCHVPRRVLPDLQIARGLSRSHLAI
jgi:hypothetical protein